MNAKCFLLVFTMFVFSFGWEKQNSKESAYFGGQSPDHDLDKLSWSGEGAIQKAIELLKSKGYKVLKPVTTYEEA